MSIKNGLLACLLFVVLQQNVAAQKRYKDEIFTTIDSAINIQYGQAINLKGNQENLLMDVIMPPAIDTEKKRPLLIFIHGGGFKNNNNTGGYSAMLCTRFAKRGYVTATIDYRLGVGKEGTNKDYYEALYRAQQDGKAAIRFFRKNAAVYSIDTNQIIITGSSAGSKTCLAIAYMDQADIPAEVNTQKWGSLDGNSGNEGYSSKVNGVMNAWGAMPNLNWINKGDVPLFNVAGTEDKTVPYDSSYDYHGFKYGPYILFQHCLSLGISTGWRPFYNTGHTLDNNKIKQDSCIKSMAAWLYTQLGAKSAKSQEGVFRWQEDIDRFESLDKVEKYDSTAIMFLGSSYIRLWKNIRQDVGYENIIHRGFGGCNLRDVAFYVKDIVYPHQLKALFIYVGNDIVAGERDKSPDQALELFKYIVEQVRKKYPTIPITWLQISPSEKRWAVWDKITEANKLIEAYCQSQPNLFYIESANKFLGDDGKPMTKYYRDDKLHYNEEGYKVWGKAIAKDVKRIAKS